jgi:hypothetical protein
MDRNKLINILESKFTRAECPKNITVCSEKDHFKRDEECKSIERDFAGKDRNDMSYNDCSAMIIDGPLIKKEAFLYFLPRLAKAVFEEDGDSFMLLQNLESFNLEAFSKDKADVLKELINELEIIEKETE